MPRKKQEKEPKVPFDELFPEDERQYRKALADYRAITSCDPATARDISIECTELAARWSDLRIVGAMVAESKGFSKLQAQRWAGDRFDLLVEMSKMSRMVWRRSLEEYDNTQN